MPGPGAAPRQRGSPDVWERRQRRHGPHALARLGLKSGGRWAGSPAPSAAAGHPAAPAGLSSPGASSCRGAVGRKPASPGPAQPSFAAGVGASRGVGRKVLLCCALRGVAGTPQGVASYGGLRLPCNGRVPWGQPLAALRPGAGCHPPSQAGAEPLASTPGCAGTPVRSRFSQTRASIRQGRAPSESHAGMGR